MGLVVAIAERLGLPVVQRGSLALLPLWAARKVVNACFQERAVVLGIDVFRLCADQTVPDMDAIADFSALAELPWPERVARSVAEAEAFFNVLGSDYEPLFDLSLANEND